MDIQSAQEADLGYVLETKTGQRLTPSQLVEKLADKSYVLLGEQHDNVAHHKAQYWLLTQLQARRPQGSLLLEMLSVDQQPRIDNLNKTTANLAQDIQWNPKWPWVFYGGLVQNALDHGYKLQATNLTQTEIQTIFAGAEPLRGNISVQPQIQQALAQLIVQQHQCDCNENTPHIQKMVQVQQFRDRRMAEKVVHARTPALLIAGNHHIDRRYGVPVHLQDLKPSLQGVSVALISAKTDATDADYLWVLQP